MIFVRFGAALSVKPPAMAIPWIVSRGLIDLVRARLLGLAQDIEGVPDRPEKNISILEEEFPGLGVCTDRVKNRGLLHTRGNASGELT
jgi:hypothetical protein